MCIVRNISKRFISKGPLFTICRCILFVVILRGIMRDKHNFQAICLVYSDHELIRYNAQPSIHMLETEAYFLLYI